MFFNMNSLQLFLLLIFIIFQRIQAYSVPSSSSSASSDSIDWDEFMVFPNDDSHHNDHLVKQTKSVIDKHDRTKPNDQHTPKGVPLVGPLSTSQNKRKRPSPPSSPSNSPGKGASPSNGQLTEAQLKKQAINKKYYNRHQPELTRKRREKYQLQKNKNN